MNKAKLGIITAVCALSFYGGYKYADYVIESSTKTVVKERVKFRERVVTVIKERPDGTKETTITENRSRDEKKKAKQEVIQRRSDWHLAASYSVLGKNAIYTLSVQRRVLGNVFMGVYGRTDNEFGVSLGIEF